MKPRLAAVLAAAPVLALFLLADLAAPARSATPPPRDLEANLVDELVVGTVNVWEVPGYRTEMSPFGGIKDSGNGCKEGMVSAMAAYTNVKTFSLPWSSGA